MIIIDASVALSWCLPGESSDYVYAVLDEIVGEGAAAPAHWPLEVANGLLVAQRRNRLDEAATDEASRLLSSLNIEIVPIELTTATWGIFDTAREHGLTAYDAAYLDLARFRRAALATLDDSLRAAAMNAGVALT